MNGRPHAKTTHKAKTGHKPDLMELSLFCHQVSLVLKTGIHPVEGIPLIAEEMVNPAMRNALQQVGNDVVSGVALHDALSRTGTFPAYLVTMTRLGETTGMLEQIMGSLSAFYEKEDRMAKRIRSAIAYPVMLLVLMLGVILLLVTQVLPMFSRILGSLGGEIPVTTRLLLDGASFFGRWGLWLLALVILLAAGFVMWLRTERGRARWDAMKLRVPLVGKVLVKTAAARFSAGLSVVLKSGMDLQEGLELLRELPENRRVRIMISQISESVRTGADLGTALEPVSLFPPLFTRMIQIGQRTGELDKMMEKIATVYEGEVDHSVHQMTNAIEPLLVLILSVVVGVVLLAVMLPLINIMGSIG